MSKPIPENDEAKERPLSKEEILDAIVCAHGLDSEDRYKFSGSSLNRFEKTLKRGTTFSVLTYIAANVIWMAFAYIYFLKPSGMMFWFLSSFCIFLVGFCFFAKTKEYALKKTAEEIKRNATKEGWAH